MKTENFTQKFCLTRHTVKTAIFCTVFVLCLTLSFPNQATAQLMTCAFHVQGDRQSMFRTGRIEGNFPISRSMNMREGKTYGYGQVNRLLGDIIIYDGISYIAVPGLAGVEVTQRDDLNALFLAYGASRIWNEIPVERDFFGLREIVNFIADTAEELRMDMDQMFMFRMEGEAEYIRFSAIHQDPSDAGRHTLGRHEVAKRYFTLENEPVKIIGAWSSAENWGRYTARNEHVRLYFINENGDKAGYIHDITLKENAMLYWPNC
jgi:hypothetical protein